VVLSELGWEVDFCAKIAELMFEKISKFGIITVTFRGIGYS
jgi:hypothetical protein